MKTTSKFGGRPSYTILSIVAVLSMAAIIVYFAFLTRYPKINAQEQGINYREISTPSSNEVNDSLSQPLPLEIFAENNLCDYSKYFSLPKDTTVIINAVGEAADYSTNPSLFRPWDNDGIEFFFNVNNMKTTAFDLNKGDRQYRILWHSKMIDGQHTSNAIIVNEQDPSSTYYIMEITFPWQSLGIKNPRINTRLGFDATIIDCDNGAEKAKIDWHSNVDEDWKSSVNYGTLALTDSHPLKTDSNIVAACRRKTERFYRDKLSIFSQSTPFYKYGNITVGYVKDSLDLSGKFRAEWDNNNLYLEVCVRDNVKSEAKALFDYGWIEDNNGKIIWQMSMDDMKYAGGALKNKREDTLLHLKKGRYRLRYHTDESHSPSKWDDSPPQTSFYGIKISYKLL